MAPLLHRQPFKAIYLLYVLSIMAFIQLPYWLIYYSWRPNRPRKTWTLQRTICARMFRRFTRLPTTAGLLTNRDLSLAVPQKKLRWYNSRFVWVPELEKEDIVGMVAEHAARAGVKPIAIPAYWILKDGAEWSPEYEKAREDEKVVLYFHGGAFIAGTAHPSHLTSSVPKGMLKHSTSLSRALSVDYRLSSGPPLEPKNPFPAAVIDAIAAYKYLVCEVGFLAENVTVAGDSAGGSLALALTRYTVESRLPHLPPPGGLVAASPWADMSFSHLEIGSSHLLNWESGIFDAPRDVSALIIGAYVGENASKEAESNRYISPASRFVEPADVDGDTRLFAGFPRSYIMGGGAEVLFDDLLWLTKRMRDDGVDITTDFPPDAVHAYPMFSWHEPERTESLIKCAAWLDECWVATVVVGPCEVEDTLL